MDFSRGHCPQFLARGFPPLRVLSRAIPPQIDPSIAAFQFVPVGDITEAQMSAVDVLRRVSLFADLREDELAALANCLGRRVFARDMIFYHKGSPPRAST